MKQADAPSPTATPPGVAARLGDIEAALAGLAGELVPERVPGHQLERVMGVLGRIERRAGGARLVLAKAAADAGAWKAAGARSAAEHLARQSGTSLGEAKADLAASERLAKLNQARDAAMGGELSKNKTRTVAEGAEADPDAESDLVNTAKNGDLGAVRDKARKARQRADQGSGRAARRRYLRRALRLWSETDGEGRGLWNVPPEFQGVFVAALEPYRAEAFRLARQAGTHPSPDALMADAFQLLCLDVLADHDLDAPEGFFDPACPDGPCAGNDDQPGDGHRHGDGDWYRNDTGPRRPPADEGQPGENQHGPGPREGTRRGRHRSDQGSGADEGAGHDRGPEPNRDQRDPGAGTSPDQDPEADRSDTDPATLFPPDPSDEHHLPDEHDPPSGPAAPENTPGPRRSRSARPPGSGSASPTPPGPPSPSAGRPDPAAPPDPPATSPDSPDRPPGPSLSAGRSDRPPDGLGPPGGPRGSLRRFAERRRIGGNRRRPRQVVVQVDHSALVRGCVEGEETCEIPGIGPVPVSAVRRMCDDAILRVIVTKGVDVVAISTDTRYVAADVQRALDARDPECVIPDCRARHHLQNHHWRYDYAAGSPTDIDHLARVCPTHHALITHCNWTLTGGPGHWQFDPP